MSGTKHNTDRQSRTRRIILHIAVLIIHLLPYFVKSATPTSWWQVLLFLLHPHRRRKPRSDRDCPALRRGHARAWAGLLALMDRIRNLGVPWLGCHSKMKSARTAASPILDENLRCPCPKIRCNLMTETVGVHCRRPSAPRGHVASHTCRDGTACTVPPVWSIAPCATRKGLEAAARSSIHW
jgi:hypothetical protein